MSTHEDLVASARRRIRVAAAAGMLLLAGTVAALVLPMAVVVFVAFALLGASWGLGWALLWWAVAVSLVFGLLAAGAVYAWSLARSERRALEFVRAWPLPGRSPDDPPPPKLPAGAERRVEGIVQGLALAAGVLPPRGAVVIDDAPNCLTVGRSPRSAWIVVTTGLLESMPRAELEALIAYEVGRVAELEVSLDTLVYACTARVFELWAGVFDDVDETIVLLAPLALLAAPAVLGGVLLRAAVLRSRARLADGLAVRYCRNPVALAHALRRVYEDPREVRRGDPGNAHLWLEYPHTRASRWFLRTHRILPERIACIERLARLS